MPIIKLKNVTKKFDNVLAIDNLSIEVEGGEAVGVLGPSGCGKTTFLRLIAGLDTLDAGTIEINDNVASNPEILIPPRERKIGMVFQDLALWPHMNAFAHLDFVLRSQSQVQNLTEKIDKIFEIVKLPLSLSEKYPHQLSGGEKQRLAIARALAQEPRILLLDEPLANLDAMLKRNLQEEIKKLQRNLGLTLIYVTHDVGEVKNLAEKLVIMKEGKIVQEGKAEEVFAHPKDGFVAGLVRGRKIE